MRIISLVPIGLIDGDHLALLGEQLASRLAAACLIQPPRQNGEFAYSRARGQYHSTEILKRLSQDPHAESWRILGVTDLDLYIPILTFVFGEAQMNGMCALVSTFRLRQEFYGLPPDAELLQGRLVKEAVHELGHTLGIAHCEDYNCVMAPSHAVEWIDLKKAALCEACRATVATV